VRRWNCRSPPDPLWELEKKAMLYGAAYYHEYQPYERLETDVRLMQDAGLSVTRVGESTWASWEPEDGRFEFACMERILDALHGADINVIFGTPTYAIPPWLSRKHPEIMTMYAKGQHAFYGGRQNMDISHPAYRYYAERIIRRLVEHFAGHPAIIGYQLDNETGSGMSYNPNVFQNFVEHLRATFGSIERLNEVWGLAYWSHVLSDWADLWTPDGNTTPGYDLEWRRFQTSLTTEFLAWQARIVREYARPDQFVTHNLVGGHGRPDSDRYAISQIVDISAENPYHPTQDDLVLPRGEAPSATMPWNETAGTWSLYLSGDLGRSGKQSNFLITEVNALSIMGSAFNYPAYDGQWRLAVYAFISRGANSVEYWHWHTLHYGAETYWGGVLNHDLEPNRCYLEVRQIGHELRQHGDVLTDLEPDADVGFLYSQESRYAFEFQPCLGVPGTADGDRRAYQRIFNTFYRAFFDARAQAAIVHPQQEFERFPVLIVPALYIASDPLLDRLAKYAQDGGHLVLTFRTGYADEYARARWVTAPGRLRKAAGVSYNEYSNLAHPLELRSSDGDLTLTPDTRAEAWADGLRLEGATALATYDHHHFGRFPAVTTQEYGLGRVTYIGTLPNPAFGEALANWVLAASGIRPLGSELPESVRVTTARARDGRRLWFWTNWSPTGHEVDPRLDAGSDLFTGTPVGHGHVMTLGPWDVRILVEHVDVP
jgi:beta-galactosidase